MPCLVGAIVLLAANVGQGFMEKSLPFTVLRALIAMIIGFAAYRTLLSGGGISGWRAVATDEGRVPWRYTGVMLMILSPVLLLGVVWTAPGIHLGLNEAILGLVLVTGYTAIYVLLGTALPEVAERGDVDLNNALARGQSNYRHIAMAMMLGPLLFRSGTMALLIIAAMSGVTVDLFNADGGSFYPAALLPMFLFTCCHVTAEIMTAVVLVRAYRRYPVVAGQAVTA